MKDWKEVVEIKTDKRGSSFIINEEDYFKYKFDTQEWEQSVIVTQWEHNWVDKTYKISYKDISEDMACFPG